MKFRIGEETHSFTSRYNRLYKFHESLLKNEDFQKSFNYNPPDFPPKSWFTDFTKPKNYKKRANKILKYFSILTSKPSILRNKQFQKGIDLPPNLQKLISQIAKGLQSKKYIEKNYNKKLNHSPHSKSSTPSTNKKINNNKQNKDNYNKPQKLKTSKSKKKGAMQSIQIFDSDNDDGYKQKNEHNYNSNNTSIRPQKVRYDDNINDMNIKGKNTSNVKLIQPQREESPKLEVLLKDLEIDTDKLFVDIVDGMEVKDDDNVDSMVIDEGFINNLKIFSVDDILPNMDILDETLNTKLTINMDLFKMMNINEIEDINDISFDIRDAIITACEL